MTIDELVRDICSAPYSKSKAMRLITEYVERMRQKEMERACERLYKSKLMQIMRYAFTRGSGHTYAQVKGVENVENAIYIVANEAQKQSTGLPKERQISITSADERFFAGRRNPVVIDHYALALMLEEAINQIKSL